jgi:hypothetical protein
LLANVRLPPKHGKRLLTGVGTARNQNRPGKDLPVVSATLLFVVAIGAAALRLGEHANVFGGYAAKHICCFRFQSEALDVASTIQGPLIPSGGRDVEPIERAEGGNAGLLGDPATELCHASVESVCVVLGTGIRTGMA